MKLLELQRHLREQGCELLREGGNHSIWVNRAKGKSSSLPRHREVKEFLARKICKDLDVSTP